MVINKVWNKVMKFIIKNLIIWLNIGFFFKSKTYFRINKNAVVSPKKNEKIIDILYEKKFENIVRLNIFIKAAKPPAKRNL